MYGSLRIKKDAVTEGKTNIATTKITPTASKLATVERARHIMSAMCIALAGMPRELASVESKLVTRSCL